MMNHKSKIKISARFWPIFDFELNEKKSRAEPSRAEKPSARAARLGLITNDYVLSTVVTKSRLEALHTVPESLYAFRFRF